MHLKTVFGLLFSLALFQIYLTSCNSGKNIVQNQWYTVDSSIVIDGDLKEWQGPFQKPENFTDIEYAIGNDAKNLFICIRIPDKSIQRRIMGLGLSVYIDTTGRRHSKVGIGYPLALTEEQVGKISFEAQKGGRLNDRALDDAYAAICQEFELLGFIEEDDKEKIRVSNLASKDLKTATGFDPIGAMVCEYKIPLETLYNREIRYDEIISLGIQVNQPEANADEDPGLFNDPSNNAITSSGQPNLMGGQQGVGQQGLANRRPSRSSNGNVASVWTRIQLTKSK